MEGSVVMFTMSGKVVNEFSSFNKVLGTDVKLAMNASNSEFLVAMYPSY